MSLVGKNIWVVGGVGTVGRGIARGLLQAGATVIVNSRRTDRLERLQEQLGRPQKLIGIHGSLKPDFSYDTVQQALKNRRLDHVVAHGAVRYWTLTGQGECDETHSINQRGQHSQLPLLQHSVAEFTAASSALASFHYSALQTLLPRMVEGSYLFVTGDGCGHPGSRRTPLGELNSHHVRGLAEAVRHQLQDDPNVRAQELRVSLPVPQSLEEFLALRKGDDSEGDDGMERRLSISEDIGELCAGLLVASEQPGKSQHMGHDGLVKVESDDQLLALLQTYRVEHDDKVGDLPSVCDFELAKKAATTYA